MLCKHIHIWKVKYVPNAQTCKYVHMYKSTYVRICIRTGTYVCTYVNEQHSML